MSDINTSASLLYVRTLKGINQMNYTINDYTEETSCDSCGCPLLPGDRAIMSQNQIYVYCSKECEQPDSYWENERGVIYV